MASEQGGCARSGERDVDWLRLNIGQVVRFCFLWHKSNGGVMLSPRFLFSHRGSEEVLYKMTG
jgi:hypothetical protein